MTDSRSDAPAPDAPAAEGDDLGAFAAEVAAQVGADRWSTDHGTVKVHVGRDRWVEAIRTARDEANLDFFSWLSAIDWARDVAVGDPPEAGDETEERLEVLCRLSTVVDDRGAIFSTDLPRDDPSIDSLVGVFGGANWHEREAHEMFGIDFRGHPRLIKLYLPDAFEGHPLRKSFPLLSREVKPWPGLVDVEGMPSEEGGAGEDEEAAEGDEE